MLLIIIWAISPLFLIPFSIVLSVNNKKQNKKIKKFTYHFNRLLREKRMENNEYFYIVQREDFPEENWHNNPQNLSKPTPQPVQPTTQPMQPTQPVQPTTQPVQPTTQPVQPTPQPMQPTPQPMQPTPQPMQPTQPVQPQFSPIKNISSNKKFNAINVVLIIGVLLIFLAGVSFSAANWTTISGWGKSSIIGVFTGILYISGHFLDKKLNLNKTGIAFFSLGTIFLPTTIITMGYFHVLGLSMMGESRFFVLALASMLFGISALIGTIKYNIKMLLWCFYFSITFTLFSFIRGLTDSYNIIFLCMAIYCVILTFIAARVLPQRIKNKSIADSIGNFSVINTTILALFSLLFTASGVTTGFTLLIFAILFLSKEFVNKNQNFSSFPFAFLLFASAIKIAQPTDSRGYLHTLILSTVLIMIIGELRLLPEKVIKVIQKISYIVTIFVALFSIPLNNFSFQMDIMTLITSVIIFANITWYTIKNKDTLALNIHGFFTIYLTYNIAMITASVPIARVLIFTFIVTFSFFIYLKSKVIQTTTSRIIFPIAVLISAVIFSPTTQLEFALMIIPSLLLLIMMAFVALDKTQLALAKVYQVFLPPTMFLIAFKIISLGRFINSDFNVELVNSIFLFILVFTVIIIAYLKKDAPLLKLLITPFSIWITAFSLIFSTPIRTELSHLYHLIPVAFAVFGILKLNQSKAMEKFFFYSGFVNFVIGFSRIMAYHLTITELDFFAHYIAISIIFLIGTWLTNKGKLPSLEFELGVLPAYLLPISSVGIAAFIYNGVGVGLTQILLGIAAIIIAFYTPHATKNNVSSVLPAVFYMPIIMKLSQFLVDRDILISNNNFPLESWIFLLIFVILLTLSRIVYRKVVLAKDGFLKIDFLALSAFLAVIMIFKNGNISTGFILLAVFFLSLYNKTKYNNLLLTGSAAAISCIIWSQNIWEIPSLISLEFNLLPLPLFSLFLYFIWKEHKKNTTLFAFGSAVFCIVFLFGGAMISGEIFDAIFLAITATIMLIISLIIKRKKWFSLAVISVLLIVLYISKDVVQSFQWWVYLLATGVILTGIAIANEYQKQKGGSLKEKVSIIMKDWTW